MGRYPPVLLEDFLGTDAADRPEAKRIDLERSGLPSDSSEIQGVNLWKEVDPFGKAV